MTTPTPHHGPRRRKPSARTAPAEQSAPNATDVPVTHAASFIEPDRRHAMISEAAYYLAEQRDFHPGHELDDWLSAERQIDEPLDAAEPGAGTGCGR